MHIQNVQHLHLSASTDNFMDNGGDEEEEMPANKKEVAKNE